MIRNILDFMLVLGKGLLIICFIFLLPFFIWFCYDSFAYRYVTVTGEKFIYDKKYRYTIVSEGQSFYKDSDYIYAYADGVFYIINNNFLSDEEITIYIDKDTFLSRRIILDNDSYYGGLLHIIYDKSLLTNQQIDIYNMLIKMNNTLDSQGIM